MVKVVIATFLDGLPSLRRFYFNRREVLVLYICIISFLLGLPHVTQVNESSVEQWNAGGRGKKPGNVHKSPKGLPKY